MEAAHCYLDGNADAVEFCQHESFHHVLAASTYTLQEGDNPSRSGSISLFDVNADEGRLELLHRVETAGIFDIKWSPVGGNVGPLLAQADAEGYVRVHRLESSSDESEVQGNHLQEISHDHVSSSLCLCLDWNPSASSIAVGLSDGSVSILSLHESQLRTQEWKAHDFEVWAASFDIHQPQLVYTGSDDCKFSCWDSRDDPSKLVFQNTKVHTMGVCCIAKNPSDPNTLLTGSYDEHLRIWDVRSISRPVNEKSISLHGGVWRIKYHPVVPGIVLTACMHNGFAVVNVERDEPEVMETYKKHGSLAYGADWQRGSLCMEGKRENTAIATCSFYDRLLHIWKPEGNII
nr:diphthine methyltransferase homolog [Ipomoea batatas]